MYPDGDLPNPEPESEPTPEGSPLSLIPEELKTLVREHFGIFISHLEDCQEHMDRLTERTDENSEKLDALRIQAVEQAQRLERLELATLKLRQQLDERELNARACNLLIFNADLNRDDDPLPFIRELVARWKLSPYLIVHCRFLGAKSKKPIIHVQFAGIGPVVELCARRSRIERDEGVVVKRDIPPNIRAERKKLGRFFDFLTGKGLEPIVFSCRVYIGVNVLTEAYKIPENEKSWENFYQQCSEKMAAEAKTKEQEQGLPNL